MDDRFRLGLRLLDLKDLTGNNRQHFEVDSVELIETTPGSSRDETFEEFGHRMDVKSFTTVEDNALHS